MTLMFLPESDFESLMKSLQTATFALALCAAFLSFNTRTQADIILIDYDDGLANGIHDSNIADGEFSITTGNDNPWSTIAGTTNFNSNSTPSAPSGSSRNYISELDRILGMDTGYDVASNATFDLSYQWIDRSGWVDSEDTLQMVLFVTDDDTIAGTTTESIVVNSGLSTANNTWETVTASGVGFSGAADGKRLFVRLENQANGNNRFARIDNISLIAIPEPTGGLLAASFLTWFTLRRRRQLN